MGGWRQHQQQRHGFLEDPAWSRGRGRTQRPSPSVGQRPLGTPTRTPTSHPGHPTGLPDPARASVLAVLRSFPTAAARAVPNLALPAWSRLSGQRGEASPALPGQRLRHCTHLKPHRRLQPELLGEARQGGDLGQGRAPSHLPRCWHSVSAVPVPGALLPWSHRGCPGALGTAGTTFPRGLSRAEHQAGYPHCLAGLGARAGSLCSAPALRRDLAVKPGQALLRAGGSRGLPGPRARPAALTAAARLGWRSPPQPSLPSLSERAEPLQLPPATLAVSTASFSREALGVSWQGGAGARSRWGPGEHSTGPTGCPARGSAAPGWPRGSGSGLGGHTPSS